MDMGSREESKKLGIKRFFKSFKHSMAGLNYAYKYEQSMLIHVVVTFCVLIGGFFFKIDTTEWIFVIVLMGTVMGAELLNTAIEAVVDLVSPEYHELAKIAKDTASAAVLVFSTSAFIVGLIVFMPRIIAFF